MYQRRIVLVLLLALLLGAPAWAGEMVSFGPLVGPNGISGDAEFGPLATPNGIHVQVEFGPMLDPNSIRLSYGPIIDPSG